MKILTLFIALSGMISISHAFIPNLKLSTKSSAVAMGNSPMDTFFSFLKDGKKGLVKSLAGDYDEAAVQQKINSLIQDNPVLMLSFTTCPFCLKAKAVLDEKGATYTVLELDVEDDGKAIRAEMGDFVGRTSVPAIWIEGQFIGGCNDGPMGGINTLNSSNALDDMLKSAGAI